MESVESMQRDEMFNSGLNNQQLWTPFFDDNGNALCFNWQQADNATRKFFNPISLYKTILYIRGD